MFKTTSTSTTYFYDGDGNLKDKVVTRSFHSGNDDDEIEGEEMCEHDPCCCGEDCGDNKARLPGEMMDFSFEPELELKVERDFGFADILRFVSGCVWAANLVLALRALRKLKGRA